MKNNIIFNCLATLTLLTFHSAGFYAQANQNSASKIETTKTNTMKEYVLLIRLPLNYGPAQAAEVRDKWNALTDQWKAAGIFVSSFVFPTESYVISGKDRNVKNGSVISNDTRVITTIFLRADSYQEALELARLAPILEQGGTVEVREVYPRPQAQK